MIHWYRRFCIVRWIKGLFVAAVPGGPVTCHAGCGIFYYIWAGRSPLTGRSVSLLWLLGICYMMYWLFKGLVAAVPEGTRNVSCRLRHILPYLGELTLYRTELWYPFGCSGILLQRVMPAAAYFGFWARYSIIIIIYSLISAPCDSNKNCREIHNYRIS